MSAWSIEEAIAYYREQGAPGDQQMLSALLREVQQETGPLTQETLDVISRELALAPSILPALIRRIPSLRMHTHPHRLEVCQNCGRRLGAWIEREYAVKNGASDAGGFTFHVVGCMKNCKCGPSMKWDGALVPRANEEAVRKADFFIWIKR